MSGRHLLSLRPKGPAQSLPMPLSAVSVASPDDKAALIDFLSVISEERLPIDETCVERIVEQLAARRGGIAFVVRGPDGMRIDASIGIRALSEPRSYRCHLHSIWFGSRPDARRSAHAKSLLFAARRFADALDRPLVIEEAAMQADNPKRRLLCRHLSEVGAISYLHQPRMV